MSLRESGMTGGASLLSSVSVHPEDFGAAVCADNHPGGYKQEIGKAVQVADGGFVNVFIAGQGHYSALGPPANGPRQVAARC